MIVGARRWSRSFLDRRLDQESFVDFLTSRVIRIDNFADILLRAEHAILWSLALLSSYYAECDVGRVELSA